MQKMEDNGGAGVVMVGIQKWSFNVEPFEENFFSRNMAVNKEDKQTK